MQPKKKTIKRGHKLNRLVPRRARKRATQNRDKIPMGLSRGYEVQKEGSRKLRHDGVTTCFENGANSTARRQEAENDSFAAYCS